MGAHKKKYHSEISKFIVKSRTTSPTQLAREVNQHFKLTRLKRVTPQFIRDVRKKFDRFGSVNDQRLSNADTLKIDEKLIKMRRDRAKKILSLTLRNPTMSIREQASLLSIPPSSLHDIKRKFLRLRPYIKARRPLNTASIQNKRHLFANEILDRNLAPKLIKNCIW